MKDLEDNYSENKENCVHLFSKKHSLVLAAKPLDFMEMFRFVCLFSNVAKCNLKPMFPALSMICGVAARACLATCLHISYSHHTYS